MDESSASDERMPTEDRIDNLAGGPWPGPIERDIDKGQLRFGQRNYGPPYLGSLRVKKHRRGLLWYRTAKAVMKTNASNPEARWDYRAEILVSEDGKALFAGTCTSGNPDGDHSVRAELQDGTWRLGQETTSGVGFFGMTKDEIKYWVLRIAGTPEIRIQGFEPDSKRRPFIYAVPLIGMTARGRKNSFLFNDLGVVAGEADTLVHPIVEQLELIRREPAWNRDNPKAFGLVMATNLLEAEKLALQRAGIIADLLHLALGAGLSHWEDRYHAEPLEWDAQRSRTNVRLSSWILIRELQQVKGWVHGLDAVASSQSTDFDDCPARLRMFLKRFERASFVGDMLSQTKGRQLSKAEEKLILGLQRALHWYAIGSSEYEVVDKFLARWIALEAILNSVTYPGVFDGPRKDVKDRVGKSIDEAMYPSEDDPLLKISPEMLKARTLAGGWPIATKLSLFAKSFGVSLQEGDVNLIKKLSRDRVSVLHGGRHDTEVTPGEQRGLEYLLERLLVAASVCTYRDLADDQVHTIEVLPIGPEGGAAPIRFDGREVSYEWTVTRSEDGEWEEEFSIEGHIFDKRNSRVTGYSGTAESSS